MASVMASQKTLPTPRDKRVTHAINVLMYFVVVTLLFQLLLAKHSLAALPYSDLLTSVCKHVNT